jgi:hypothetical protein
MILEEFKLEGNVAILTGCGHSWSRTWFGSGAGRATVVTAGLRKHMESAIEKYENWGVRQRPSLQTHVCQRDPK